MEERPVTKKEKKIMKYTELKRDMQGRYCRNCINAQLETRLLPEDCVYEMYPNPCQSCGNMRNIVEKVRWRSLYKVL